MTNMTEKGKPWAKNGGVSVGSGGGKQKATRLTKEVSKGKRLKKEHVYSGGGKLIEPRTFCLVWVSHMGEGWILNYKTCPWVSGD